VGIEFLEFDLGFESVIAPFFTLAETIVTVNKLVSTQQALLHSLRPGKLCDIL